MTWEHFGKCNSVAGGKIRKTEVDNVEVAPGGQLSVSAEQDRLLRITLPGGEALPAGVRVVRMDDRIVLRYPDGTEVSVTLD